jgi:hypothetical protein
MPPCPVRETDKRRGFRLQGRGDNDAIPLRALSFGGSWHGGEPSRARVGQVLVIQ